MSCRFKLSLSILALALSSAQVFSFSYVSKTFVKMTRNGKVVLDQAFESKFNTEASANVNGQNINNYYSSSINNSGSLFSSYGRAFAYAWAPPTSFCETSLVNDIQFSVDKDGDYIYTSSASFDKPNSGQNSRATLKDLATGQILVDFPGQSGSNYDPPVRLKLKANRTYQYLGSASVSFGAGPAFVGGNAYFEGGLRADSPVPEPGTISFLLGVGSLALRKRRRS